MPTPVVKIVPLTFYLTLQTPIFAFNTTRSVAFILQVP
jgi:hypothetical protein